MFGLLDAEENTPESRLLLVHFASSIAARDPMIKVAGRQSDSTELSETTSKQFRLRSCRSYSRAISQKNATAVRVTNVKSAHDDADSPAEGFFDKKQTIRIDHH